MQIETARLVLRDHRAADVAAVRAYRADPRYGRFYMRDESGEAAARAFVDMVIAWAAERPRRRFQLAIARRDDEARAVGSVGVRLDAAGGGRAEFGCELAPSLWGRGYAREAGQALLDRASAEWGVTEVRAETAPGNEAALRLAASLGFARESVDGDAVVLVRRA